VHLHQVLRRVSLSVYPSPFASLAPSAVLLHLTPCSLSLPDDYLLAPIQLDRALEMILASVLFKFHSTRMLDLIVKEATKVSSSSSSLSSLLSSPSSLASRSLHQNPSLHGLYVVYTLLIKYGHRSPPLYRNLVVWRKLWPGLMDTLWADCEDVSPAFYLIDCPYR
jgi:hypothetical protein